MGKPRNPENITDKQWRVASEINEKPYRRTFDNQDKARRVYGSKVKEIEEVEEGWVELQERDDKTSEWHMVQEFYLGDVVRNKEVEQDD